MARGKRYADSDYINESRYEKREREREERERRYQYEEDDKNDDSEYEEYDDDSRNLKIKIICGIAIVAIVLIVAIIISTTGKKPSNVKNEVDTNTAIQDDVLISFYQGYDVVGKIKIDKINIEQYILDSKDEAALKKGVTKLYGDSLNGKGNFCISGHNTDDMFGKLNELDRGDTITIIDKNLKETNYSVKEIMSADPTNLEALISDNEKTEITLITCENASTKRLIIKAEEKQ